MFAPTVADVMTRDVVSVQPDTPFKQVVALLDKHRISAVAVLGARAQLIGVISEADLLTKERHRGEPRKPGILAGPRAWRKFSKATARTAADVMTSKVKTIGPNTSLSAAARQLVDGRLRRLFVVDSRGALVGVLARRDVLRVFTASDDELARAVSQEVLGQALWLAPNEASVHATDGEITLEGNVERRSEVERAGALAAGFPGVVAVHNRLTFEFDDIVASRL